MLSCSRSATAPRTPPWSPADQFGDGDVAVLYADNPLIRPETLRRLLERRAAGDAALALLAFRPADAGRYGRVITRDGYVERIVEWIDAAEVERAETLCNAGVLCAAATDMARWLRDVRADNAKGEYYLTDVVALAHAERRPRRRGRGAGRRARRRQFAQRACGRRGGGAVVAARGRHGCRRDDDRSRRRYSCARTPNWPRTSR